MLPTLTLSGAYTNSYVADGIRGWRGRTVKAILHLRMPVCITADSLPKRHRTASVAKTPASPTGPGSEAKEVRDNKGQTIRLR
jgi:hypothetical protein